MSIKALQSKTSVNLIDRLFKRDLIKLTYPDNEETINQIRRELTKPSVVYAGFDPTSDTLHVGNLAIIMNLLHFYKDGHQVICLIGDSTARVGDPSGHSKDRGSLLMSDVNHNSNSIEKSIKSIFANFENHFALKLNCKEALKKPLILRNSSWYNDVNVIDFMDKVFRPVRVGNILHKKSVRERISSKEGLNMSEFSYQIFQAYDWQVLRDKHNCKFQIGGSDQAGNIYTGYDSLKKRFGYKDTYGLLVPLLVDSSGNKLGKSSLGKHLICLNPKYTSPTEMYQRIIKTPHSFMEKFLKTYTFLDLEEIEYLVKNKLTNDDDITHCQRVLARSLFLLIHGKTDLDDETHSSTSI